MPLVQFVTLSETFLMKFLGKLLEEKTEESCWLMYKNKGEMFLLTNDQAVDENFFVCFSSFFHK